MKGADTVKADQEKQKLQENELRAAVKRSIKQREKLLMQQGMEIAENGAENDNSELEELMKTLNRQKVIHSRAKISMSIKPLSANPTKWSNKFKEFVGNLPTNCLSVFDNFVELALKGLKEKQNLLINLK